MEYLNRMQKLQCAIILLVAWLVSCSGMAGGRGDNGSAVLPFAIHEWAVEIRIEGSRETTGVFWATPRGHDTNPLQQQHFLAGVGTRKCSGGSDPTGG